MELRHLRYFIAAAEEEHFGRASERLHVTRPAISQIIADLEAELGTLLFERQAHRVTLTAAGKALLPPLQAIMGDLNQAIAMARRVGEGKSGALNIGYGSLTLMHPLFRTAVKAFARDLKCKPVYLQGIGEYHTHEHLMCAPSLTEFGATESGRIAYDMAGLGPGDIDVAQLYDCFTIVPILELEELGFVKAGEGGAFFAEGHAGLGGKLPVNTHGGMLSHAHAGAAGGLFGIVEAVRQLRGGLGARQVNGAEVALVHNEGGILSSHCTVILANDRG
ncbi:thiolase C-terminal domain-containing protein [Cupriavidus necator]